MCLGKHRVQLTKIAFYQLLFNSRADNYAEIHLVQKYFQVNIIISNRCWISDKDGFLWIFFAPVIVITSVSTVTVVKILKNI